MRISHESIYRDLYIPSRNVFDRSMFDVSVTSERSAEAVLRPARTVADRSRTWCPSTPGGAGRDREVAGHWEGGLLLRRGGAQPEGGSAASKKASSRRIARR